MLFLTQLAKAKTTVRPEPRSKVAREAQAALLLERIRRTRRHDPGQVRRAAAVILDRLGVPA